MRLRPVEVPEHARTVDRYAIAALGKGLAVLRAFSPERVTLSVTEVAKLTGAVPSSALRLLTTLADLDFCEEVPGPRYRPSTAAIHAGYVALGSDELRALARPVLERLSAACGEAVVLATMLDAQVVHLDRVEPTGLRGGLLPVGARYAAAGTALGKAMLASKDHRIVASSASMREAGYWIDEHASGVQSRSVAAPVAHSFPHDAAAVAVFVVGNRWTTSRIRSTLAPMVVGAAAEIGAMGHVAREAGRTPAPLAHRAAAAASVRPAKVKSRYHIEALARGLRVMTSFTERDPRRSVPSLAKATGLPTSAVFRVVRTLAAAGYLRQSGDGNEYVLALRALDFGYSALAGSSYVEIASPLLQMLHERFGGLAFMSVLAGHESVDVAKFVGPERSVHGPIRYPLYPTAGGKVLLAYATERDRSSILRKIEFVEYSARTITTEAELRREIARVRKRGYAINDQEWQRGRWAVAAPVIDSRNRCVAAMGIMIDVATVPAARDKEAAIATVVATAGVVSARLRYLGA
jgi:IclR family pca regulon transcriptional regulator